MGARVNMHAEREAQGAAQGVAARVLVVGDTPAHVKLLEDLLLFNGYEVEVVAAGEEALAAIRGRAPDLVLLDAQMPGLSGFDVCRAVRADSTLAMLPVVLVTAQDDR